MPEDPYKTTPLWRFGSERRVPTKEAQTRPPPGAYELSKPLKDKSKGKTLAPRLPVKDATPVPGPGTYTPAVHLTVDSLRNVKFGEAQDKEPVFLRRARACPGPGAHEALPELGGNLVSTAFPSYSFSMGRKPLRQDSSGWRQAGPGTQFNADPHKLRDN